MAVNIDLAMATLIREKESKEQQKKRKETRKTKKENRILSIFSLSSSQFLLLLLSPYSPAPPCTDPRRKELHEYQVVVVHDIGLERALRGIDHLAVARTRRAGARAGVGAAAGLGALGARGRRRRSSGSSRRLSAEARAHEVVGLLEREVHDVLRLTLTVEILRRLLVGAEHLDAEGREGANKKKNRGTGEGRKSCISSIYSLHFRFFSLARCISRSLRGEAGDAIGGANRLVFIHVHGTHADDASESIGSLHPFRGEGLNERQ